MIGSMIRNCLSQDIGISCIAMTRVHCSSLLPKFISTNSWTIPTSNSKLHGRDGERGREEELSNKHVTGMALLI